MVPSFSVALDCSAAIVLRAMSRVMSTVRAYASHDMSDFFFLVLGQESSFGGQSGKVQGIVGVIAVF